MVGTTLAFLAIPNVSSAKHEPYTHTSRTLPLWGQPHGLGSIDQLVRRKKAWECKAIGNTCAYFSIQIFVAMNLC